MAYVKKVWVSGVDAVDAPALNNMEDGIEDAHDRIDLLTQAQILTYQYTGDLDGTTPAEFDFILPAGITSIDEARVVVRGKEARDITSGASAAVGSTGSAGSSTSSDGSHTHSTGVLSSLTSFQDGHDHSYNAPALATGSAGAHSHAVSSHSHTLNSHTHTATKELSLSTTPDNVNVYVDNGGGFGPSLGVDTAPVLIDTDISAGITTASTLKRLRITSSRLGRVDVTLMIVVS